MNTETVSVVHRELVTQGLMLIANEMDVREHTEARLQRWHQLAAGYHGLVRALEDPGLLRQSDQLMTRISLASWEAEWPG